MKLISVASILVLSSEIGVGFGFSIRGTVLKEKEQRQQQPTRTLQLRSGEAVVGSTSEEPMDDVVDGLFRDIEDEAYDRITNSYNQLSFGIDTALLQVNPDIDEEDLVYFRQIFIDFLEDENHVPDTFSDTSLSSSDEAITEGDGGDDIGVDTTRNGGG